MPSPFDRALVDSVKRVKLLMSYMSKARKAWGAEIKEAKKIARTTELREKKVQSLLKQKARAASLENVGLLVGGQLPTHSSAATALQSSSSTPTTPFGCFVLAQAKSVGKASRIATLAQLSCKWQLLHDEDREVFARMAERNAESAAKSKSRLRDWFDDESAFTVMLQKKELDELWGLLHNEWIDNEQESEEYGGMLQQKELAELRELLKRR